MCGDPGALRYEQAMTDGVIADPSLRWHDPDQVQRVRLAPSQPVTGHPSEELVIRYLLFDYNGRAVALGNDEGIFRQPKTVRLVRSHTIFLA